MENEKHPAITNGRTLTKSLAKLAGDSYNEGDIVNDGYAQTLKLIEHRNTVLDNDVYGAENKVLIPAKTFEKPATTSNKSELECLVDFMDYISNWASVELGETSPTKWKQLYWSAASACYAYEPKIQKDDNLLEKFKLHNWWLPTEAQIARIIWYIQYGDLYKENIFSDAILKGVFVKNGSTSWASTFYDSTYAWCLRVHILDINQHYTENFVRPVCAF